MSSPELTVAQVFETLGSTLEENERFFSVMEGFFYIIINSERTPDELLACNAHSASGIQAVLDLRLTKVATPGRVDNVKRALRKTVEVVMKRSLKREEAPDHVKDDFQKALRATMTKCDLPDSWLNLDGGEYLKDYDQQVAFTHRAIRRECVTVGRIYIFLAEFPESFGAS